jgi:hypothetical protein
MGPKKDCLVFHSIRNFRKMLQNCGTRGEIVIVWNVRSGPLTRTVVISHSIQFKHHFRASSTKPLALPSFLPSWYPLSKHKLSKCILRLGRDFLPQALSGSAMSFSPADSLHSPPSSSPCFHWLEILNYRIYSVRIPLFRSGTSILDPASNVTP